MTIKDIFKKELTLFSEAPNQIIYLKSTEYCALFEINLLSLDSMFEIIGQSTKICAKVSLGTSCKCASKHQVQVGSWSKTKFAIMVFV